MLKQIKDILDYDTIKHVLEVDGSLIQYVENPSEELCKIAISDRPFAIENIKNPSYETCKEALSRFENVFVFIPNEMITKELCEMAIFNHGSVHNFRYVPDKFKTYKMCLYAVKIDSTNLKYVPKEFQTDELC